MEHFVGAKAGSGLAHLVDGFLERQGVAQTIGEGMVVPGNFLGSNAASMGQTMLAEGASQLGAFGSMAAPPQLDVDDFLATSARYAQQEAMALAQMDSVMAAVQSRGVAAAGSPSVEDFMAFQAMLGPSATDFAAFQAMQGPSTADFAALQTMQGRPSADEFAALQTICGPSVADFVAFQLANGSSFTDFTAFQASQGPTLADFVAYQQMQGPSNLDIGEHELADIAADFAAYHQSQGPSAADFAAFQDSQTPSIADFQAFQAAYGPSVHDFQSFQLDKALTTTDLEDFRKQMSEAEDEVASLAQVSSGQAWDAALANALGAETLGLSDSKEPLATMCAANQIPAQVVLLEAKLRLTRHFESGLDADSIHVLLQQEIDRLVLMDVDQQWPEHRQRERACLISLLIEQQLQVKVGLETQLQYHREAGRVTVTNPANGYRILYGFHPLEGSDMDQLVCTELTLEVRNAFLHPSALLTLSGPPGTGKTETLIDICKHTVGRPFRVVRPTDLTSKSDLGPLFALMDAGIFVILDAVDKCAAAAELLPDLIAHAQVLRNPSLGPILGISYQRSSTTDHIDELTTSDPAFGRVEMTRPPLNNILRPEKLAFYAQKVVTVE